MKRALVAPAAALLFLASGTAAQAAGTARLDVFPDRPRAGELATVQVRTFVLLDIAAPTPWAAPADLPLVVSATSPGGRELVVRLARDPADPYLWSGTLRFSSSGLWTLCALDFRTHSLRSPCNSALTRRDVQVRAKRARVDVWHRLERPFHIPSIAGGSRCPTSSPNPKGDLSRLGFAGPAWGEGPAYPGGLDRGEGKPVLRYADPIPPESGFYGSTWFGNKVLWMVDPAYRGPVLVRGRQLDGPNELRFDRGVLPPRELRISPRPAPSSRPSYTRLRAPGCYAYQVDGLGFSYTITFEARPVR